MMPIPFAVPRASIEDLYESQSDRARKEQAFYEQEAIAAPWRSALKALVPMIIIFALSWALSDLAPLVR
jgi:hypothetical protein